MRNEIKKEGHRSSRKRCVLCGDDVDYSIRFGRCCGSGHKHLDYGKVTGGVGRKQCRFPRDRRSSGGFAVC